MGLSVALQNPVATVTCQDPFFIWISFYVPNEAVITVYTSAGDAVIQHNYVCIAISKGWESVFIFLSGYGKPAGI